VPRPVAALSDEYPSGFIDPRHTHERGQLLYAVSGVTLVITDETSFIVPPQRAVWVPGGVPHEVHCRGALSVRTVYVDTTACRQMPTVCRVIEVSSLLRELLVEAANIPVEYDVNGRDGRVMALLLDEIASMTATPLHVPMPQNDKLLRVCLTILGDPAQNDTLMIGPNKPAWGDARSHVCSARKPA
jgi:hypothetical protein